MPACEQPLPYHGLVVIAASPITTSPVATGSPSTTKRRIRLVSRAIASTSVIGSARPSSVHGSSGVRVRTAASHASTSRNAISSRSTVGTPNVIENVPLSP